VACAACGAALHVPAPGAPPPAPAALAAHGQECPLRFAHAVAGAVEGRAGGSGTFAGAGEADAGVRAVVAAWAVEEVRVVEVRVVLKEAAAAAVAVVGVMAAGRAARAKECTRTR
jgi:hypothetical protein